MAVGDLCDQPDREFHRGRSAAAGVFALGAADRGVDVLDDHVRAVGAVGACGGGSVAGAVGDRGGVGAKQPEGDQSLVARLAVGGVCLGDQVSSGLRGHVRRETMREGLAGLAGSAGRGIGVRDVVKRVLVSIVGHAGPEADVGERERMKTAVVTESSRRHRPLRCARPVRGRLESRSYRPGRDRS